MNMSIIIKDNYEIDLMRQAGRIVAIVLEKLAGSIKAGMKTKELDSIAADLIARHGGIPSFKGYRGYPANICVSINDEIVHGIPGERILKEGDLVSLDVGVIYKGFQGDGGVTVGVEPVSKLGSELMAATKGALAEGIKAARAGANIGDLSNAIQQYAERAGFSVVREYAGHGIGVNLHEDPSVPNYGQPGQGEILRRGMTLAIEPMVNAGTWKAKVSPNKWTVLTADGSLSAYFEHTIVITEDGADILTLS